MSLTHINFAQIIVNEDWRFPDSESERISELHVLGFHGVAVVHNLTHVCLQVPRLSLH